MENFASLDIDKFYGTHECDCGNLHTFDVRCALSHGAFSHLTQWLSEFAPPLSRVAIFYTDERNLNELLPHINREYRVSSFRVTSEKKEIGMLDIPEDARLVIALDGAVDSAKYKAYTLDLPLVIVGVPDFYALSPRCTLREDGLYCTYKVSRPKGCIFDCDVRLDDNRVAEIFGDVAARLNTSLENYATAHIGGKKQCKFIPLAMSDIAAKAILGCDFALPKFRDELLAHAFRLALLGSLDEVEPSGEAQCALCYDMLSGGYSLGTLRFVFAALLTKLYYSHVNRRPSFVPPPDNNYRLSEISELFDISEIKAIKCLLPQLSGHEAAMFEYKMREYRGEFNEKLVKNLSLFSLAFKTFKRLLPDDGYSLTELVGGDLSLCIALSPDMIWGSSLLNALKRNGELDAYII